MSAIALDPLIAEAKRRGRRRRLLALGAVGVAAVGLYVWAAPPGTGGGSWVMGSSGPVSHVQGYVSSVSAASRIPIDSIGSSGGVTWAESYPSDGTWLTTDGGRSWHHTNVYSQGLEFVDKRHGWAVGACGVERTTDGGSTWHCSSPKACPDTCAGASFSFLDARHGFVLEGGGVEDTRLFGTRDGGRTWQLVSRPPQMLGPLQFVNERLGFAGDSGWMQPDFYDGPWIEHLYRTTDGGVTWSNYEVGGTNGFVEEPVGAFGDRMMLAQNPPNPSVKNPVSINANLAAIWVSSDAGVHWHGRPVPAIPPSNGIFPSALSIASPRDLVVAHGGDLYMTSNGGASWRDVSLHGLPPIPRISQLEFTSSRVGWAVMSVGQSNTLVRTTDGGLHWRPAGPLISRGK